MRVPARPAATICLLHDGGAGVEVLMCRRVASARFMGGAWVFPGGAVDPVDVEVGPELVSGVADEAMRPWVAAALRELVEEVGVWITDPPMADDGLDRTGPYDTVYAAATALRRRLDGSRLAYFANWITPAPLPRRFDARFFAVAVDAAVRPRPDPVEVAAAEWVRPEEALTRAASQEWDLPFPTVRTLEMLAGGAGAEAVVARLREIEVVPVQPRLRVATGGIVEVVTPDDDGFDDLDEEASDAMAILRAGGRPAPAEVRGLGGMSDAG